MTAEEYYNKYVRDKDPMEILQLFINETASLIEVRGANRNKSISNILDNQYKKWRNVANRTKNRFDPKPIRPNAFLNYFKTYVPTIFEQWQKKSGLEIVRKGE